MANEKFQSILVFALVIIVSCKSISGDQQKSTPAVKNSSVSAADSEELKQAIHNLATTLKNAPKLPASASTDAASDINILSKNASALTEAQLTTLFNSGSFTTLKQDVREASASATQTGTETSSSVGTGTSTGTSTNTATSAGENWFTALLENASSDGNTQLTLLGTGLYLSIAVWNVIAAGLVFKEGVDLWPERWFFSSVSFVRSAFGMGLSLGFLALALGGVDGEWSSQTFQDVEGTLLVVDGVTVSIWTMVALYEQQLANKNAGTSEKAEMRSYVDRLFDPEGRANPKTPLDELKMKQDYYSFLVEVESSEWDRDMIDIYKGMSSADRDAARRLVELGDPTKLPDSGVLAANNSVANPYRWYLKFSAIPKILVHSPVVSSKTVSASTSTKVVIPTSSAWKDVVTNKSLVGKGKFYTGAMSAVLGVGILKVLAGAYILDSANSTQLALANTDDPKTNFFRDLTSNFQALFLIHDKIYPATAP